MKKDAFTLVELLVVISVIAILMGLLLPALKSSRDKAVAATCSNNVSGIYKAFIMYEGDYDDHIFWDQGPVPETYMDRYVYGGRSTGNLYSGPQGNLFNNIVPRPLNQYVGNLIETFHCPRDVKDCPGWNNTTKFEQVGNSYAFNNYLCDLKLSSIKQDYRVIIFTEASEVDLPYDVAWHNGKANTCYLDGHIVFMNVPPQDPADPAWAP